jgi:hypothetical protein
MSTNFDFVISIKPKRYDILVMLKLNDSVHCIAGSSTVTVTVTVTEYFF